ncbi:unnamed protein product [Rotaria sordida]|uniref:Uncharacterized protein n=1 Tax=Rotaria sordida TaxID=392033 RepID=A0A815LUK0_9BILA|nr:unnamed protein product [Rotaria sordida]CAF1163867.1 unnamed protein product [Rotaria sordida]CAF1190445.1 unnamed protein product [Rotaria sordida]CAF1378827.1 unnamed protein product [Rotaria sordida]CAF1413401.1 unnamed protein product [Rotaria sordida]
MADVENENNKNLDQNQKKKGGKKRNLTIICLSFVCAYTSYNAVANLQSSVNTEKNVGLYSLVLEAVGSIFGSLFLTTPLMYTFGYKWIIVIGQIGVLAYTAANMYPKAVLMYSSKCINIFKQNTFKCCCLMAIICDIFCVSMCKAQNAYVTVLGIDENAHDNGNNKMNKYFGILFSAFQTSKSSS